MRPNPLVARAAPHPLPPSRPRGHRPRPGVTLVEILVVVAIIGILLALTAAGLQKTAENQNVKSSTDQVFKLQQALDMEYQLVVDKCAQDASRGGIPQEVISYCDGDVARAKAVWTAYNLRLHFPESVAEATATGTVAGITVQPLAVFRTEIPAGTTFASPQDANGALLYVILAKKSVRGGGAMALSADDLTQAMRKKVTGRVGGTDREFEAFTDAWKNTVGFSRWYAENEVQNEPYVDPAKAKAREAGTVTFNRDPLDPQNLVWGWANATNRPPVVAGLQFNAQNRMATVYSVGKDKTLNSPLGTGDDIFGFRLRKQGNTGRVTQ